MINYKNFTQKWIGSVRTARWTWRNFFLHWWIVRSQIKLLSWILGSNSISFILILCWWEWFECELELNLKLVWQLPHTYCMLKSEIFYSAIYRRYTELQNNVLHEETINHASRNRSSRVDKHIYNYPTSIVGQWYARHVMTPVPSTIVWLLLNGCVAVAIFNLFNI